MAPLRLPQAKGDARPAIHLTLSSAEEDAARAAPAAPSRCPKLEMKPHIKHVSECKDVQVVLAARQEWSHCDPLVAFKDDKDAVRKEEPEKDFLDLQLARLHARPPSPVPPEPALSVSSSNPPSPKEYWDQTTKEDEDNLSDWTPDTPPLSRQQISSLLEDDRMIQEYNYHVKISGDKRQ